MKIIKMLVLATALLLVTKNMCAMENQKFKSEVDSVTYIMGMQIASFMTGDAININTEILMEGIKDQVDGKNQLEGVDINSMMQNYQMKKQKEAGSKNSEKGLAFLAENKKKEGITVTASGLQYEVIKEGTGAKPLATDKVKVHYTGKTTDGVTFDSSVDRGQPIDFPLNGVIKGWTEGVQLMKVGAKYRFYIPSELAYGEAGAGGSIGPNEVLIFDVELLDIIKEAPVTPTETK